MENSIKTIKIILVDLKMIVKWIGIDSTRPSHLIDALQPIETFSRNAIIKRHTENAYKDITVSDAPIPVFTNRSDTDTFYTEMADTDPIPILGAYHCSQEIHSMLHLFL